VVLYFRATIQNIMVDAARMFPMVVYAHSFLFKVPHEFIELGLTYFFMFF